MPDLLATSVYDPAYGGIPNIPTPQDTAGAAVSGAIGQGNKVYNQLPGYQQSLKNIGGTIQDETAGKLPGDVLTQIQQGAAERGIATGTAGSDSNNAAYLRALGLTSLDMTQRGQANLNAATQALPGAAISQNPNFYVSPQLAQETAATNAIYRAAPNPRAAAMAAMAAAQAGIGAGRGAVPSIGAGQNNDWWNNDPGYGPAVTANSTGTGMFVNGQYVQPGGQGAGAGGNNPVDKILQQYDPMASLTNNEDYQSPWHNGGTAASDTAPAGTSSGYYYAGDDQGEGGTMDDFYNDFDF